jgi:hypothetical protein
MDTLQLLRAKINIKTTLLKLKISIEEIELKNPHREDLIKSMKDSYNDLLEFHEIFLEFEQEYHLECKTNFRLQLLISEQNHERDKLQDQIVDLTRKI